LAAVALVGGVLVAMSGVSVAGGNMHVEVDKVVVGTAPAGTTFTVHYSCTGGGPSGDLTFDATGAAVPPSSNFFNDGSLHSTCTISETGTGGAANVTIQCVADSNATCAASGNQVTFTSPSDISSDVTFTVTNANTSALSPLTVAPSPATPGQQVTVSGTGCTKALFGGPATTGGGVQATIGFPTPVTQSTTAAGTTGAWSVQFTVPPGTNGPYPVNATCEDPVAYASATLTVAAAATPAFTG